MNNDKQVCLCKNSIDLNIGFLNINHIFNKFVYIHTFIEFYKLSIFCICETWLDKNIFNSSLDIPQNFKCFRIDRPSNGGGIIIFVHRNYVSEMINCFITSNIELLNITVKYNFCIPIHIITIYRPPNCSIVNFFDELYNFLCNLNYIDYPIILNGDFNINLLDDSSSKFKI